jgi:hypothetical protein
MFTVDTTHPSEGELTPLLVWSFIRRQTCDPSLTNPPGRLSSNLETRTATCGSVVKLRADNDARSEGTGPVAMAGIVGVEPTLRGLEALVLAVIRNPHWYSVRDSNP